MPTNDDPLAYMHHWGKWVKARAVFLGIPLKELAAQAKTSPQNLSRWLKSKNMPPLRGGRNKYLAEALKVHSDFLPEVHHEAAAELDHFLADVDDEETEKGERSFRPEMVRLSDQEVKERFRWFVNEALVGDYLRNTYIYATMQFDLWADGQPSKPPPRKL